jgi:hypothetical protein
MLMGPVGVGIRACTIAKLLVEEMQLGIAGAVIQGSVEKEKKNLAFVSVAKNTPSTSSKLHCYGLVTST